MTLRGRLTTAFLAVVLGPVLLGSFFVGVTVATVTRDRTMERLDHAATTVRSAIGSMCRQLQAVADAVAVLPAADRRAAADQMVARGLATEVRLPAPSATGSDRTERDCATPRATEQVTAEQKTAEQAPPGQKAGPTPPAQKAGQKAEQKAGQRAEEEATAEEATAARAVVARAVRGDLTVIAVERLDPASVQRLADASGARVRIDAAGASGAYVRHLPAQPGQPLPLTVSVEGRQPAALYVFLACAVLAVACIAIVAARGLARSTTRPLEDLAWAAGKVAAGELGVRVPTGREDEIGRLARTFNRMTRELQGYVQALTASRDQLRGHLAILGDTLSSTHDLHRILEVILQTALSATGARAGIVLLVDQAGDHLVAHCAEGLTGRWDVPPADLPSLRIPVGHGVLGGVAAGGEGRRGRCGLGGGLLDEPAGRTFVAVPIRAPATVGDPLVPGGRLPYESGQPATLGVLALYDRLGSDQFDDTDLLTLRTFAGQAGVAVHNVRVHEEAQRLSLTDPLTGLWNYRYLRESLRREVDRAGRFGRTLAVLVLDLDHFKLVNDTHGHAAGDAVLAEFARRIRVGLREVDVAFRQGGEEFVVLLPETDAYGGIIVAERLGAAVRDIPVPIDARRTGGDGPVVDHVAISVSIGIAVHPEHGRTAQQVLDAADDALYAAKNAGRDTYRVAETVPLPAVNVTDPSVSAGVPDGKFDHQGAATGAPGGPQPPRQARGR